MRRYAERIEDQKYRERMERYIYSHPCPDFAPIRKVYASLPHSKSRGLLDGHFSFNVAGGRCDKCQGAGMLTVPMHFLPDVAVRCPACRGRRFKRAGNTVIVVEHNLDVVKVADWIIDLGPEGGKAGGKVVAQGTPEQVAEVDESHTGRFLRPLLARRATECDTNSWGPTSPTPAAGADPAGGPRLSSATVSET